MDLYIDRDALGRGLARVQGIIERRSTHPLLSHVLLHARDGGLRMTATDTEVAYIGDLAANVSRRSLDLPHHKLSLVDGKTAATITDPAALPTEFMVQPAPRPDLHAIARALKHGPVPGAATRNAPPHIRISAKKEAVA